ncbi:hypothetical protein TWF694_007521 [Orbilia ellipsospora]|uniref:Uncharacterized protein n=1 Tax=Orbilia ellipsospora TaxID=2528407 RepID=A0AAV9XJM7_9PEZI
MRAFQFTAIISLALFGVSGLMVPSIAQDPTPQLMPRSPITVTDADVQAHIESEVSKLPDDKKAARKKELNTPEGKNYIKLSLQAIKDEKEEKAQ